MGTREARASCIPKLGEHRERSERFIHEAHRGMVPPVQKFSARYLGGRELSSDRASDLPQLVNACGVLGERVFVFRLTVLLGSKPASLGREGRAGKPFRPQGPSGRWGPGHGAARRGRVCDGVKRRGLFLFLVRGVAGFVPAVSFCVYGVGYGVAGCSFWSVGGFV